MDKYRIVYLISNENRWEHLFGQIKHINMHSELVDRIAIIVIDTAILACLKSTILEDFKNQITTLKSGYVDFFLCNNTFIKFGFKKEDILPEFELAMEGGILKALSLEKDGYKLFTLGL